MSIARVLLLAALLLGARFVFPAEFKYQRGDWKIDRIRCSNASACKTHYCNVKLKSAHVQLFNVGCELIGEQKNIETRLRVYYKSSSRYLPFLIDIKLDYCSFMAAKSRDRNPMAAALLPMFTKYSNINHTCPLSGMILMKDARLDRSLVMGFQLPIGKYISDFHIYHKDTLKSLFLIQTWFTVLP